ncbi:MAG TPA: hypothetical protein VN650_08575 [Gemmatimonadaceae bacterium]|nr:hypothetical protein [Gemmatimonadaceae bacterium]
MADTITVLDRLATVPTDAEPFAEWLRGGDALEFLRWNASAEETVIFVSTDHTYVHGVFVPSSVIDEAKTVDLLAWDFNATGSWGISHSFSPASLSIVPPLDHPGSNAFHGGERLVFQRFFEGRIGTKSYFEILQRFTHVFDLHYVDERSAYCRLDERGDLEDVIRIRQRVPKGTDRYLVVITCHRDLLDQYMTLTNSVLAVTFDFTRYRPSSFSGWPGMAKPEDHSDTDLHYRLVLIDGYGSYLRGVQIVRSRLSREALLKRFDYREPKARQYASFIAQDWKNKVVREISTAPEATANYFTKSDLPFELSPAFFRPEVLQKYKADTDKYRLDGRSISCRGAWSLETYDINEAGQVHTYIVYLRRLPYEEQLHWKAYNEKPKAPISERAVKSDFQGNWDLGYDALVSLKQALRSLDEQHVEWWKLRSSKLLDQANYPVTTSADEWANEILHLDQLVVEGFDEKGLWATAGRLGRTPAKDLRSLKLVEECLIGSGIGAEEAKALTAPFHRVHNLRSKVKGHASGDEANSIKKNTLMEHGSYVQHFQQLCAQCDRSIRRISDVFGGVRQ